MKEEERKIRKRPSAQHECDFQKIFFFLTVPILSLSIKYIDLKFIFKEIGHTQLLGLPPYKGAVPKKNSKFFIDSMLIKLKNIHP